MPGKCEPEAQVELGSGTRPSKPRDDLLPVKIERPQIVDAVAVIGMFMGPDHRRWTAAAFGQQLFTQIRRAVDQDTGAFVLDEDRYTTSPIARFIWITITPVPIHARYARRRARAKNSDLHDMALVNNR